MALECPIRETLETINETIDGRDMNKIYNSFIHVSARAKFFPWTVFRGQRELLHHNGSSGIS